MGARGVVIVGAGQGGLDTAAALRSRGHTGRITLIGEEPAVPYQRPPLSKAYLTGSTGEGELALRAPSFFATQGIDLRTGERVDRIDRAGRSVTLGSGSVLAYDTLVLATGARPRTLPVPGAALYGVLTLRSLADAEVLRRRLDGPPLRIVVVGAGFIGLELTATARTLGHEITVVEAQPRALSRALTPEMSRRLLDEHRDRGVRILLSREVNALHGDASGRVQVAELDGGERIPADLVVVGIGVLPNTELAADAGLLVGDGIVVDPYLRTDDPDIYAIGDCARYPSPHTFLTPDAHRSVRSGQHVRVESVQNAAGHAQSVAATICGEPAPYTAVPWFWSEQYSWRLQIAGLTAGHDECVVAGARRRVGSPCSASARAR